MKGDNNYCYYCLVFYYTIAIKVTIPGHALYIRIIYTSIFELHVITLLYSWSYNLNFELANEYPYIIMYLSYIVVHVGHRDIITQFGINGDGLNRATRFEFQRNIHVLCGATEMGVELDWFFANGTKVGTTNRNVREGHFENGTASLQIASDRNLNLCDAGVYTCRANQSSTGRIEQMTFTLIIGSKFSLTQRLWRRSQPISQTIHTIIM